MSDEKLLELAIHFTATTKAEDAPLQVHVEVQTLGLSAGPIDFALPLDHTVLAELRWYLEVYPQWPVGPDYDRALGIEAKLRAWGKALFDAAFADRELLRVFDEFRREKNVTHLITIDATDPRVLQLPWELLADEGAHLFAMRPPISVRRRLKKTKAAPPQAFTLPMRILFVVSRPEGAGFLDPRSSAQALLDAIEPLGDQVVVEFLYPPTLEALTDRVRSETLPPIHVVHFDGHGVYLSQTGLGYLLFENDAHEEQLVNADDLGTLLNDTGVPLMILDACQTAQADKANPFGSVASKLIEAGIGSVLAMNYSVFVEATRLLTAAFYGALAAGKTIGQAVDAARFAMLKKPERFKLYRNDKEEAIQLRDWFLPALYQQSIDPAPFSPSLPPAVSQATERTRDGGIERVPTYPARGGFPAEPRHGFHGRARELLHLQRTLAEKPIVVVHGYGGQGKTTLAAHAARWFTRTHRFERAVFVSFENGGGLEWALSEMGNALIGDNFAIHQGDPIEAIAAELHNKSTLVVWDNFESILPNGNAPLPDKELQNLLNAAARWFAVSNQRSAREASTQHSSFIPHPSSLVVTTRDPSLPHPDFEPGALTAYTELPGLGRLDALELAGQILKDRGIPHPPREKLSELLVFLGGHPLSIQLVVPHLRNNTPEKLIAEFDALLPGFTTGAGKERNENLRVSLDFSLRRLGAETQKVLPDLAVFQGGAMEAQVLKITGFKFQQWRQVRDELARAALLTIDQGAGIGIHTDEGDFDGYYVRFHPTLLPYLTPQLTPARRTELEARYAQAYYALANYEYKEDNKNPLSARAVVARELPNFRRALDLVVAAGDLDTAADFANSIAMFLNVFGRWSERDAMMKMVSDRLAENRDQGSVIGDQAAVVDGPSSTVTQAEYLMLSNQGERLLQLGRAGEAERVFRALLARLGEEPSYERALTFGSLGRCLKAQGRQGAAEMQRQELAVLAQLEQTQQMKRETGIVHTDLADVLAEMGQFDAARQEYEVALRIAKETNDDRQQGVVLSDLGTLALSQNNLDEAHRRYLEALVIFRANNEPQSEATLWHQLGRVAEEARDWAEAERCYKESLGIKERLNDAAGAARTSNQLANVAEGAGRPDEAERWYKRALELGEEFGDKKGIATRSYNLANLYLTQNRLDEAEQYVHRAIAIAETLDLSVEPWKDYSILAQIAEKRGRVEEARAWRRKADETYAAYVDRSGGQANQSVRQWEPRIQEIVTACNGNAQVAQELEPFLQRMESKDDWRNLIPVLRRIMQGERGVELTEGLDAVDAAIVRRVLGLLLTPQPPLPTTDSTSSGEGETLPPSPSQGEGRDEGESEQEGITLEDILNLVIAGAKGDQQAGGRAYQIAQALQHDRNAPPDARALGKGFQNVLEGLRGEEAVQGLPPEAAQIVRAVLEQL